MPTINSLPQEIIFLILEFVSSPRSESLVRAIADRVDIELESFEDLYEESNAILCASALVCKSWTHSAQSLLLRSVVLNTDDSIPHLLNAPLSQFQVNHLYLMMPDTRETANPQVGNFLSKLNGLKSLHLLNDFNGCVEQVLDVSVFSTPGLSELEYLNLTNLSITDENNFTSTVPTFKLKQLNVKDVVISDSASKFFVTPALTKESITQHREGTKSSVNILKLAAHHLKVLHMDLYFNQAATPYISIIPLCTSVTEFSFFFDDSTPSFFKLISAFATNQLLHLKLFFYFTEELPNLLTLISQPSLRRLQSLTLIAYKYQQGTLEEVAVPIEVLAECTRRGIIYKYEIIEHNGNFEEEEREESEESEEEEE